MDLIDRDELELDTEWSDRYDGFTSYSQSQINGAVEVQAIIIPEGATNGDMIMTMFPNAIKSNYIESGLDMRDYVIIYLGNYEMRVSCEWWNAPYKGV